MSELSPIASIRNFGIIAHIDAGKTTVSERILYYTHKIFRIGEVHDGNSTMDFMPEEQERGITIVAASTFCEWKDHALNFIDTPGHVDFTIEVERSLRVLDGAVGVFCAVNGVEPQSETVWRQSEALAVPKLAFINKMDKVGADFEFVLDSMKEKLQANPILIQIPLFKDDTFYAIADLIRLIKLEFNEEDDGETIFESELLEDEVILASLWREKMLETLADIDENFLDIYIQEKITENDIQNSLRRVCIKQVAVPTLVGAARKNKGVQPLLDAICNFLPSPLESSSYIQEKNKNLTQKRSTKDKLCQKNKTYSALTKIFEDKNKTIVSHFSMDASAFQALVFKIFPQFFGTDEKAILVRIYNGILKKNDTVFNLSQMTKLQVKNIYRIHADFFEEIETAHLGEIIAITGFETIKTGDTLISLDKFNTNLENNKEINLELLESISEYQPVISLAFEAKNQEEILILQEALSRYSQEDPTLILQNEDTGNFLVSGMGELHLEVLKERIQREYKIIPRTGNPQVVLCQSIKADEENPIDAKIIFEKEINEVLQYASISLSLINKTNNIHNLISFSEKVEQQIQAFLSTSYNNLSELKNSIEKSVENTLKSGSQTGYHFLDIHVNIDSIEINQQSTNHAFAIATHLAIKEALNKAQSENKLIFLEPIMYLEVLVPDENLSACMNLIQSASGNVNSFFEKANLKCIVAHAPMRKLFGFATRLRSVSQGRANFLMRFQKYERFK